MGLFDELSTKVCHHPAGYHDHLEGPIAAKSGYYNVAMATCILVTLFPGIVFDHVPAMPVKPFVQHAHRDKHLFEPTPSLSILAAIHKLWTRKEMMNDPVALQSVRDEVGDFRRIGVWDDNSVMVRAERIAR